MGFSAGCCCQLRLPFPLPQQQKNKNKGKKAPADPRAAALRASLAKHGAKKAAGKRRGLFVIPQAFGRDVQGPDALQALRSKLAAL